MDLPDPLTPAEYSYKTHLHNPSSVKGGYAGLCWEGSHGRKDAKKRREGEMKGKQDDLGGA